MRGCNRSEDEQLKLTFNPIGVVPLRGRVEKYLIKNQNYEKIIESIFHKYKIKT